MNISFGLLGKHGRLGNQLFQISSTLGLAKKYGATASFPDWSFEQYFESPIPHGTIEEKRIEELHFHHHDWNLQESCDLKGYLQSEKYFDSWKPEFKRDFVERQKSKYPIFDKETICIQIRRGDYVGNPNYYQLPITYYILALTENFPDWRDYNILVTSDDIEYCRTQLEGLPNATFSENSDIEDLALGSACDHFIISSSTFGWWQAFLGEKPHSKIVCSGYLFDGRFKDYDVSDYWPERWMKFKRDSYRIPLNDMTFTIPVAYDHEDRFRNLSLTLCMLQRDFDSNYLICEQGGEKFKQFENFAVYSKMNLSNFHRTRMLNWMAETAKTPFIANWDADVIIPPLSVYLAVEELRSGADMAYPYGGKFARMPREPWFAEIEKSLDIGIVGATAFKNRVEGHMSVGGAVFFNRDSFIDGGMENEKFIAYGPEDYERDYRFRGLGYDVRRVGGTLFHMYHWVGVNSAKINPFYEENWAEWKKVQQMSREQLREYRDTFSWWHRYTGNYRLSIQEGSVRSAEIVMAILGEVGSVIDIGCGLGEWNNGNPDYFGVDFGINKESLLISVDHYIDHDLTKPFLHRKKYDLCLCLEVAEHLPEDCAERLIRTLCRLSDRVLFSAAIPNQGGQGHVNERWQTYWEKLFKKFGFGAAKKQPNIRCQEEVEFWYRQNIVLYEKGGKGKVEDFVLPAYYEQISTHFLNRLRDYGR